VNMDEAYQDRWTGVSDLAGEPGYPDMSAGESVDTDGLWETYHHIAKLDELGHDERGNTWLQQRFQVPLSALRGRSEVQQLTPDRRGYMFVPDTEMEWYSRRIHVFAETDELCGTAMCFAGWYGALHAPKTNGVGHVINERGHGEHVADFTARHCGGHPVGLFAAANNLSDIRKALVLITGVDRA
jgi:hypothetical protein